MWKDGEIEIGFFEVMSNKNMTIEEIFLKLASERFLNGRKASSATIRNFQEHQSGLVKYLSFEYLYEEPKPFKLDHEAECWLHLVGEK